MKDRTHKKTKPRPSIDRQRTFLQLVQSGKRKMERVRSTESYSRVRRGIGEAAFALPAHVLSIIDAVDNQVRLFYYYFKKKKEFS